MLLTCTISEEAEDNVEVPVEGAYDDDDDDNTRSHNAYIKTDTDSEHSDNKANDNKNKNGTSCFCVNASFKCLATVLQMHAIYDSSLFFFISTKNLKNSSLILILSLKAYF